MTSAISRLRPLVMPPSGNHTATMIFLHGSGDTGSGIKEWVKHTLGHDLQFLNIRIIYPSAPIRTYTPSRGQMSSVWFDRTQISPFVAEDLPSLDEISDLLNKLIAAEVKSGIPENRIVLGGFSMGGALSLYHGLKHLPNLAGIFALSAFLNEGSSAYEAIKSRGGRAPPLLQCHGTSDPLVDSAWGEATMKQLKDLGVDVKYHTFPNLFHEMNKKELKILIDWTYERLNVSTTV